jgi:hypothetical protein
VGKAEREEVGAITGRREDVSGNLEVPVADLDEDFGLEELLS